MAKAPMTFNIDDLSTWQKYRKNLCNDCHATCCTLPVEVKVSDLVRMELVDPFEADDLKGIAKRLQKARIIDSFSHKTGIFTLARMANDDCLYLDRHSRRCTIYDKRPETCRNHPQIGPKPNYCPYRPRS
ncbi:YkgJ family cysteine cluster protein [Shewanella sedimentimangrovi]|uniref:YkgJ family cysteine cluster protein n=1 Tax=Shewanella sedimentimangrovi TaxID=2814293 RepID=A0ABX7R288_9GAMM|nr:YkgJ family cysteine cluster protein [Shewanella sedimentimangrovi]QSX36968.1 YkgJ family cysteine cluster protein [Shewanella sedimentimangrovi]